MAPARLAIRPGLGGSLCIDWTVGLARMARGRHCWRGTASRYLCSPTSAQCCVDADLFGLHRPGLAAVEIMVLWAAILATTVMFHPVNAAAALLLVPYLAWVSFAAALNLSIWRRNRSKTLSQSTR